MEIIFYIFIFLMIVGSVIDDGSDDDCDGFDAYLDPCCFEYWVFGPGSKDYDDIYD